MDKPHFKKVVIAGVGLMGGSLGMVLKAEKLADQVVGFVRRPHAIQQAKARGCIDSGTLSASVAAQDAELVVLAGPVSSTPDLLRQLMPHLQTGCLITDVGSTKTELLRKIEQLMTELGQKHSSAQIRRPIFVSSHPMAGSEKAGVRAAQTQLYRGALCILIKTPRTPLDALARLEALWRAVGCGKVSIMNPQEHDRLTAAVSHLPHAMAVVLANLVADLSRRDARVLEIAASGFRDTTRIAASHPKMWLDIFNSNREEILVVLDNYIEKLAHFKNLLQRQAEAGLFKELERASQFRSQMEKNDDERHSH